MRAGLRSVDFVLFYFCIRAKWPIRLSNDLIIKRLGVFLLPLDGILVHHRVTTSISFAGTRVGLCESKMSCPRKQQNLRGHAGHEHEPLDPETSVLAIKPPHRVNPFIGHFISHSNRSGGERSSNLPPTLPYLED